jgi:hypothetical protein
MTDANRTTLKKFGKAAAIFVGAFLTITANAAVWNAACGAEMGGFEIGVSIMNFLAEATLIGFAVKKYLIKG